MNQQIAKLHFVVTDGQTMWTDNFCRIVVLLAWKSMEKIGIKKYRTGLFGELLVSVCIVVYASIHPFSL